MAAPTDQAILTEAGLFIITESDDYLVTEAFVPTVPSIDAPTDQAILTESGLFIVTENGDYLVTEAFVPTVPSIAAPRNQAILTESGLFIITESGDYLVTEAFILAGGGRTGPKEKKKDSSELWEVGASIYSINDNALKERVNIKKYIMEENDIKVSISNNNVYLRKPKIINENIIVKLLSTRIKE